MNTNLTKYLSDVLRNEVPDSANLVTGNKEIQLVRDLVDQKIDPFVTDKRFSLRLDEII